MIDGDATAEVDGSTAPAPASGRRARHRARLVTYGLVAGLFLATQFHVERWPVTAFQLFSQVRTDRAVSLELVAVDADGGRQVVRLGEQSHRVGNPGHQLALLREDPPDEQLATVHEWLALAGLDAETYSHVQLERVERRLDPDGGPAEELDRVVVAEVVL